MKRPERRKNGVSNPKLKWNFNCSIHSRLSIVCLAFITRILLISFSWFVFFLLLALVFQEFGVQLFRCSLYSNAIQCNPLKWEHVVFHKERFDFNYNFCSRHDASCTVIGPNKNLCQQCCSIFSVFFYRIFLFWQLKIYDDFFSFVKLNVSSESRLLFQFAFGFVCVFEVIEMK